MLRFGRIIRLLRDHVQFVVHGDSANAAVFEDYVIGPELQQVIQQIIASDPNRYGTPPASKSAVESLSDVEISEKLLASDDAQCAICRETFRAGDEMKQLPCKHVYHKACILPWLHLHNSCPVCRYVLPTDDPDYEKNRGSTTQTHPPPSPSRHKGIIGEFKLRLLMREWLYNTPLETDRWRGW